MEIPDGPYNTVAGFILDLAGRIPEVGETVDFAELRFRIAGVKGKRITRVKITRQDR
jgi:putative hemolysin